ncbi:ADP-ribosylglycohydrolase family protein [Acidithiobacillus ferrooxidans]|uniref:ADP-ribosylglycohydrolase family protein n=1 Tax=Acidithiobacillus ferrooxidans TaxID=920 RepID=UPI00214898DD|nr:ADP-ribosylglycohydrolase family protein [Acidithiobacillus ferrooxidans]MCR1345458.1 ADP-ribosylglycohydrolase family protein [Acidithiobacillus ferrooxidans]MCR1355845.1 ADP-ribosylglycohydrolase family protein [Acidithiobacillus ferrooxidans]
MTIDITERIWGGFLGGAIGDALGEPVEFLSKEERLQRWGPIGVRGFVHPDGMGRFTDDTQMTLFTAEALILHAKTGEPLLIALHKAYLRWLVTQKFPSRIPPDTYLHEGFLLDEPILHKRMGPGRTCLRALMEATDLGMPMVNDSKGCGGLMRVAPIGFWAALHPSDWDLRRTFTVASQAALLTHGHPCGYLTAGFFAVLIRQVTLGLPVDEAVLASLRFLETLGKTGAPIRQFVHLAQDVAGKRVPWEQAIQYFGAGWVAEEILAIAVYLGLTAPDFRTGIIQAANHPGDADSVGAIAGQLLGALHRKDSSLREWTMSIEGCCTIEIDISKFLLASPSLPQEFLR